MGTGGEEEDPASMMMRQSGIREKILEKGAGALGRESQVTRRTDETEGVYASGPEKNYAVFLQANVVHP
jgi:hypothetical protein